MAHFSGGGGLKWLLPEEGPSPAKKGRAGAAQGSQPPRCQVEECEVDLSDAKAYYCRHKVCGMHSKSPKVIVAGLEQRFCQQCSRFHQLSEFDQGKRSCRRRLAGHNERRRKPPPILSSHYGTLSPFAFDDHHTRTGALVMDFGAYNSESDPRLENQTAIFTGEYQTAIFTGKYQLPWRQSNSNSNSGPGLISSEDSCSISALSLLSNDHHPRTRPSSLGAPMAQQSVDPGAAVSDFSWGSAQMSHGASCQYSGDELGLARSNQGQYREFEASSGGYDHPSV